MTAQTILPANSVTGGYEVANSLRFNRGSSDNLSKSFGSGNRNTFTISAWVKRSSAGASIDVHPIFSRYTAANDAGFLGLYLNVNSLNFTGYNTILLQTNRFFRDFSAWYHIVLAADTTQGTAANRLKLYVNGVQETSFATANYPDEDADLAINENVAHYVGRYKDNYMNGYMSEVCFIDGLALAPTSFGEFDEDSGIWKPIKVSGLTFGTNGFYHEFKQVGTSQNSSGMGADTSGNDNHFAVVNLTALDQSTDTCTNNFCTLNPLSANEMAFSNGNLDVAQASDDGGGSRTDDNARGTIGVKSGKWYWETKLTGATAPAVVGICFDKLAQGNDLSGSTGVYAIQNASGTYAYSRLNGTTAETAGFPNPVANNIMSLAFDADNAKLYIGINGTYYNLAGATGDPAGGSNETFSSIDTSFFWLPWIESRGDNQQALMNFGSGTSYAISSGNADANGYGNFEYAVPSGYFALNTKNLAEHG